MAFLPITKKEIEELGWDVPDFVLVTGDAYVDHPTFGVAIISRLLESYGYKSNDRNNNKGCQKYPPVHRSTVSKVLQPAIYAIESHRSRQDKTNNQNNQITPVEQYQYLRSGRS